MSKNKNKNKKLGKLGIQGNFNNLIKGIYKTPTDS